MKCPGCNSELAKHEIAQPMTVMGSKVWPRSFCDKCITPWMPGDPAALERLVRGEVLTPEVET